MPNVKPPAPAAGVANETVFAGVAAAPANENAGDAVVVFGAVVVAVVVVGKPNENAPGVVVVVAVVVGFAPNIVVDAALVVVVDVVEPRPNSPPVLVDDCGDKCVRFQTSSVNRTKKNKTRAIYKQQQISIH